MEDKTTDEQPKRKIARKVVTDKRQYFVPEHGMTVEANSSDDAVKRAQKLTDKNESDDSDEEGDG